MKAVLALLGTLLLLASANATVVIYQGTARQKQTLISAPIFGGAKVLSYYLLVDYEAKQVAQLATYVTGGKKYYVMNPPESIRFATPTLPGGKTATVIASGSAADDPASHEFGFRCFHLLGTNTTLTVRKSNSVLQLTAPKTFVGNLQWISQSMTDSFVLLRNYVVTFQPNATLQANGLNRSLLEALQELENRVVAKGFSAPE